MRLVSFFPPLRRIGRRVATAVAIAAACAATFGASATEAPVAPAPREAAGPSGSQLDDLYDLLTAAPDEARAAEVRRLIDRARMVSGSATADLLVARAAVAERAGESGLALDLLDAAIVVAPRWAGGLRLRGLLQVRRGATASGAVDLTAALRLDPRDGAALAVLAGLAELDGRKREALDLLKRARAVDPNEERLRESIERLTLEVEGRPL